MAGATGLVGRAVLADLLAAEHNAPLSGVGHQRDDAAVTPRVHVLYAHGRQPPESAHARVHLHAINFGELAQYPAAADLPKIDVVYIALGTTLAAAGSKTAFRAVDYDAVMATARCARAAGATRCGVVSAMGADPYSRIFYSRVKGEVERDLQTLGFTQLVIARPSLLLGDRAALGQAPRAGESLSMKLLTWFKGAVPTRYRAREAGDVGRALVHAVQTRGAGVHVLMGSALDPQ